MKKNPLGHEQFRVNAVGYKVNLQARPGAIIDQPMLKVEIDAKHQKLGGEEKLAKKNYQRHNDLTTGPNENRVERYLRDLKFPPVWVNGHETKNHTWEQPNPGDDRRVRLVPETQLKLLTARLPWPVQAKVSALEARKIVAYIQKLTPTVPTAEIVNTLNENSYHIKHTIESIVDKLTAQAATVGEEIVLLSLLAGGVEDKFVEFCGFP